MYTYTYTHLPPGRLVAFLLFGYVSDSVPHSAPPPATPSGVCCVGHARRWQGRTQVGTAITCDATSSAALVLLLLLQLFLVLLLQLLLQLMMIFYCGICKKKISMVSISGQHKQVASLLERAKY